MDVKKTNLVKLKTSNIVSVIIVFVCLCYPFTLLVWEVPPSNKDIFNFLTGSVFGTGFSGAIYYLFNYRKKKEDENDKI